MNLCRLSAAITVSFLSITRRDVDVMTAPAVEVQTPAQRSAAIWQTVVFVAVFAIIAGGGTYWRSSQLAHQAAVTSSASTPLGDLSAFRQIAQDTLVLVQANNLSQAKMRITDLETAWDDGQARLKPMNPDKWTALDGVIDTVLKTLRALQPNIAAFSLLTTHACTTNRLCRDSKTFTPTKKADG